MGNSPSVIRDESANGSVDTTIPAPGCFTLYENNNYTGCKATRCAGDVQLNCSQGDNIGKCDIMPCADNCKMDDGGCFGFGDKGSSIKVGLDSVVTLYKDTNHSGNSTEYRTNLDSLYDFNDSASSWKIQKDCDKETWLWDSDCSNQSSNTINSFNMDSKKNIYCNKANLQSDSRCQNWCKEINNQRGCKDSLKVYCNDPNNITSDFCRSWCTKNAPECDQGAINYCKNHLDNTTFCGCFDDNMRSQVPDSLEDLFYGGSNTTGSNNRAICWSKACVDQNGYMTQNMKDLLDACPSCYQVSAANQNSLNNINNSKININAIQSCNVTNNSSTSTSIKTPTSTTTTTSGIESDTIPEIKSLFNFNNSNIKSTMNSILPNIHFPINFNSYSLIEEDLFILLIILFILLIIIITNIFSIKNKIPRRY